MADLATIQQIVSAALIHRERSDEALPLIDGDPARARDRLAIYRSNVAANAAAALTSIYPITRKLVGVEFFDGLAHAYRGAHPSVSGDLNELGEHLADFVKTFAPAQSLPYLPDVARMEWLVHKAHYAADHASLDMSRLASIREEDYPRLAMTLHPAAALLTSAYPLFRIWEVHQDDYRGEIAVDLGSGAETVVVYRPQYRATVARLARGEVVFLTAIGHGDLLGTALDRASAADAAFDFAASLQRWATENIIVDLSVGA
jgi:hypothetical protein